MLQPRAQHHFVGIAILAVFLISCHKPAPQAGEVSWPEDCPRNTKEYVVCLTPDGSATYVLGLAKDHGWRRGDLVDLFASVAPDPTPIFVGYARVVQTHSNAVQVNVCFRKDGHYSLQGATA